MFFSVRQAKSNKNEFISRRYLLYVKSWSLGIVSTNYISRVLGRWLWNLNRPSLSPNCLYPSSINQLLPADISWYISLNRFTWIMDSNVGFTGISPMMKLIWGSQMVIPDGDVLLFFVPASGAICGAKKQLRFGDANLQAFDWLLTHVDPNWGGCFENLKTTILVLFSLLFVSI